MTKQTVTTKPRQPAPEKRKRVLRQVRNLLPGELGRVHCYKNPLMRWPVMGSFPGLLDRIGAEALLHFNTVNRGLSKTRLDGFLEEIDTRTFHRPRFSMAWVANIAQLIMANGGGRGTALATYDGFPFSIEVDYDIYYCRDLDDYFALYSTFDHIGKIRDRKDDCEVMALKLQLPQPRAKKVWPEIAAAISVYLHGSHYQDLRSDDVAQLLDDELLERDLLYERFFRRFTPQAGQKVKDARLRQVGVMAAYLHAYDQDSTLADEFFYKMLGDVDEERALSSSLPRRLRAMLRDCIAGSGKSRNTQGQVMRGGIGGWLATTWQLGWEPYVAGKHRASITAPVDKPLFPECQRR